MRYEIIEAAQNSPCLRFEYSAIELLAGKLLHRAHWLGYSSLAQPANTARIYNGLGRPIVPRT
jgi:hypothetical protein